MSTQKRGSINRCGGIIFNHTNDKVLLVLNRDSHQKGENKWGFPKGHRKNRESIINCAQREIKEETGLNIPRELFKKRIFIHNSLYFVIYLRQDYETFDFLDKKEIAKVEWKNLKQLKLLNMNRDVRKFLSKNKDESNFDLCQDNKNIMPEVDAIKIMYNNFIITI